MESQLKQIKEKHAALEAEIEVEVKELNAKLEQFVII